MYGKLLKTMNQTYKVKVEIPKKNAYSYEIVIGCNLLEKAEALIKNCTNAKKFLIVTNEKVEQLYGKDLKIKNSVKLVLKDGEEYKNFEIYKKILDTAVENKLQRTDCIVAFGGGVIGDAAGFAAATYMRGVDFVQIPTTLLAQVDSSVGGKVAINHEHGKNLIGAFYQPKIVIADTSVLKTLDLRQLKTGLAEVLKYAFIEKSCGAELNYRFFDFLKQNRNEIFELNPVVISNMIKTCCELKACVVNKDETEKGLRTILNLGHTFAHAIENLTNYTTYTHGEAVALGMKMAFNLSAQKNMIDKEYLKDALSLIDEYAITPGFPDIDKENFYNEMFLDKKAQNGKIRFVLPDGLYHVTVNEDIAKKQIFEIILPEKSS